MSLSFKRNEDDGSIEVYGDGKYLGDLENLFEAIEQLEALGGNADG